MARQDANETFLNTAFLYGANAGYIEDLHARYEKDPSSVDAEWQAFFGALKDDRQAVEQSARGASWKKPNWPIAANGDLVSALDGNWAQVEKAVGDKITAKAQAKGVEISQADVQQATRDSIRAIMLIRAYRVRGHLHAKLDPLGINPRPSDEELHPSHYGFTEADWDRKVFLDNVLGLEFGTIREIVALLERTYCQTLGVEFMHISDPVEKAWIQERIEGPDKEITFTREGKRAILNKLVEAEGFEKFLDVRYTGTKRFGLDGSESLIPALEQIIKRGGNLGCKEIVLGMAHRGRLNVLTQVMGKPHRALFHEFKGGSFAPDDVEGSGDVKYHLGASSDRTFDGNNVHLSLTANPSHLEIVDPVVLGKVRAKQDQHRCAPDNRTAVMPSSSTATRPSRARAWWRNASAFRACAATAPAARSISSSTTRSASPPTRASRAPRPIRRTWPRWWRRRSST
jgi:2-oxoglutarate dehydrogenase E1 component